MFLDRPTFVLERRINQPLTRINPPVSTGRPLVPGTEVALGSSGSLCVDSPLRRTLGSYDLSWRANARLVSPRGALVAHVEIEIDAWSADATRLQLRPVAQHPERWSARRLRRYFDLAHHAADHTARRINAIAATPQLHPLPQHFARAAS